MIENPKRSVTRFFIPLIDVLTLLFCIFLLMPLVKAHDDDEDQDHSPAGDLARAHGENKRLSQLIEDVRQHNLEALQKDLTICVMEIDAATGYLFYYDRARTADRRVEVTANTVQEMIAREQGLARGKPVYFLFLYPRPASGSPLFPLRRQREQYDRWFNGVPHGYELPMQAR